MLTSKSGRVEMRTQASHLLLFQHAFCSTILNPALCHCGERRHLVAEKRTRRQSWAGEVTATRDDSFPYVFYAALVLANSNDGKFLLGEPFACNKAILGLSKRP